MHADIAAGITPFDRVLQGGDAVSRIWTRRRGMARRCWIRMINRQAQIIAYNNDFRMMALIVVPPLLLLLLMRSTGLPVHAAEGRRRLTSSPPGPYGVSLNTTPDAVNIGK